MFRFLKDLYLTAFTVPSRLGVSGTPAYCAGKGVAGVALTQFLVLLAIAGWIEILSGTKPLPHLKGWEVMIAFLVLYAANRYALVSRRHGLEFEREFTRFKKSRKIRLLVTCVAIILFTIAFFVYSAVLHRRAVGKP